MKLLAIGTVAATLALGVAATAAAQTSGTMNGVQHVGAKARCSPGDPNVMVSKSNKTFVLDKSVKPAMMEPGAAKRTMGDQAAAGAAAMPAMKSGMVSMCKSEALSMGAKMQSGGMGKSGM